MGLQPLRSRRDYGMPADGAGTNPYLNTPPTKLKRDIGKAKGRKKKQMQDALSAWRTVVPGPFRKGAAKELLSMAEVIMSEVDDARPRSSTRVADAEIERRARHY